MDWGLIIIYLGGLFIGTIIGFMISSYRMSDKTVFGKFFIAHNDGEDTYNVALENMDDVYQAKRIILEIEDINSTDSRK